MADSEYIAVDRVHKIRGSKKYKTSNILEEEEEEGNKVEVEGKWGASLDKGSFFGGGQIWTIGTLDWFPLSQQICGSGGLQTYEVRTCRGNTQFL